MRHRLFPTHPYTPGNISSSLCASDWLSGFCPHSTDLWTSITCEAPHKVFPEGMAYQSCHPSQDLLLVSDPSCHPSSGCYLQPLLSASQHKDLPEQRWSHLKSSMSQGRTSNGRSALSQVRSGSYYVQQLSALPTPLHSGTPQNHCWMNIRTYWVPFLWYRLLSYSVFHCPHRILR